MSVISTPPRHPAACRSKRSSLPARVRLAVIVMLHARSPAFVAAGSARGRGPLDLLATAPAGSLDVRHHHLPRTASHSIAPDAATATFPQSAALLKKPLPAVPSITSPSAERAKKATISNVHFILLPSSSSPPVGTSTLPHPSEKVSACLCDLGSRDPASPSRTPHNTADMRDSLA